MTTTSAPTSPSPSLETPMSQTVHVDIPTGPVRAVIPTGAHRPATDRRHAREFLGTGRLSPRVRRGAGLGRTSVHDLLVAAAVRDGREG